MLPDYCNSPLVGFELVDDQILYPSATVEVNYSGSLHFFIGICLPGLTGLLDLKCFLCIFPPLFQVLRFHDTFICVVHFLSAAGQG